MKKQKKIKIFIPEGYFEGRCEDCTHACRTYRDKGNPDKNNREMYCEVYDYHFFPADIEEKECSHYKMRLGCKIKLILYIYLLLAGIVFGVEIFKMIF